MAVSNNDNKHWDIPPSVYCSSLLDPVDPGKAFAGMLDLIEKGQLGSNEPILFLHAGGLPALFAF